MSDLDAEALKAKAEEAAAVAKETAVAAFEKAQKEGFFSHFTDYNENLFTPYSTYLTIKEAGGFEVEAAKAYLMTYASLSPSSPKESFILFNVLALWLGVAEAVLFGLLGHGWLSLIWNGGVSYCVAYTLYWVMTCSGNAEYMKYGLGFIALYILFNIYMGMSVLIFVVPAVLYFTKAFIDVLMAISGYVLYKAALELAPAGDAAMV